LLRRLQTLPAIQPVRPRPRERGRLGHRGRLPTRDQLERSRELPASQQFVRRRQPPLLYPRWYFPCQSISCQRVIARAKRTRRDCRGQTGAGAGPRASDTKIDSVDTARTRPTGRSCSRPIATHKRRLPKDDHKRLTCTYCEDSVSAESTDCSAIGASMSGARSFASRSSRYGMARRSDGLSVNVRRSDRDDPKNN
jgi:hypothetical protein